MQSAGLGRLKNLSFVRELLSKNKLIFINSVYANAEDRQRLIEEANRCTSINVVETDRYINIKI